MVYQDTRGDLNFRHGHVDEGSDPTVRKTSIFFLIFLIISTSLAIPSVKASVWSTGFNYRKLHSINGSIAGLQTYYPIKIFVHYGSGIDSEDNVYLNSKSESDFGDVNFTNCCGTNLDYWIETGSLYNSDNATFWVEVDFIPASPNKGYFYIYYGKTGETTKSNGTNTFPFFDDFLGVSLDLNKWEGDTGFASVSGSYLTFIGAVAAWREIECKIEFYQSPSIAIRQKTRFQGKATQKGSSIGARQKLITSNNLIQILNFDTLNLIRVMKAGVGTQAVTNADTTEHIYEILWVSTILADFYKNEVRMTNSPLITNVPIISMPVKFESIGGSGYGIECDWVLYREYSDPEPLNDEWGDEETEPTEPTEITVIESDAPWIAIAIILSIIAFLLAMGKRK